ncbi:MAG: DinB family protein [Candidatus Rokuibacteriota bacterium]
MGVPAPLVDRLKTQHDALPFVLARATPSSLEARPRPEEWSAREHLAHLARHQAVFLDRLRRLLAEERPALGRYRAEEDPDWPDWAALPLDIILERLRTLRADLVLLARRLSPVECARTGLHPTFGELDVAGWLEFFLLHEAHHLYTALVRLGEAGRRARPGGGGAAA